MSLRSTLAQRLNDTWHGSPWHGDSSDRILSGVSAADASRRVLPNVHTIHEIAAHMLAWTETVAARVRGSPAAPPQRGDWPPTPDASDAAWQATLDALGAARKDLLSAIQQTHEEDIQVHVRSSAAPPADTGVSRAGTVVGLIGHDIYHLGQIALLKRAMA